VQRMSNKPRLIAFNLPQYHAIPENDAWWGKGFTEWTNVKKAPSLFPGHYQPRVPADLGYYNLLDPHVRDEQARLARDAGIFGFCYYHYWFNGKLLLEKPLHDMLELGKPDLPFCLCWANEPWTRAWDGRSGEVLLPQKYGAKDDEAHIKYLKRFFQDPRYIRIDGKPVFLIYKSKKIPDIKQTTATMRKYARELGIGEIYLCRVETYSAPGEHIEPSEDGFDAAVQFEPDWLMLGKKLEGPEYGTHSVYTYKEMMRYFLTKPRAPYTSFPSVFPSWDNSARRKREAIIFLDSKPEFYQFLLTMMLQEVKRNKPDEQIVFINAWNEWGEGNYLEPDTRFGHGYLEATRAALNNLDSGEYAMLHDLFVHIRTEQCRLQKSLQTFSTRLSDREAELLRRTNEYEAEIAKARVFQQNLLREIDAFRAESKTQRSELDALRSRSLIRRLLNK